MKKGKIYIYGPIGGLNGVSAEWITRNVNYLKDEGVESFIVYINSTGGDYFEALAIYNVLKGLDVEVKITGSAASAAALIAMAGKDKKVFIAENSFFMVHNVKMKPKDDSFQDENDYQARVNDLKTFGKTMKQIFMDKTGKNKAEIEAILNKGEFLNAQEAVGMGFADKVINIEAVNQEVMNYVLPKPEHKTKNQPKEYVMDPKALRQKLNLPETATDKEVAAKIDELNAAPPAPEATLPEGFETRIKELEDNSAQNTKDAFTAKVDALVEAAISDYKILPADKEIFSNAAQQDFDKTKARLDAIPKNLVKPGSVSTQPDGEETNNNPHAALTEFLKAQGRAQVAAQAS